MIVAGSVPVGAPGGWNEAVFIGSGIHLEDSPGTGAGLWTGVGTIPCCERCALYGKVLRKQRNGWKEISELAFRVVSGRGETSRLLRNA